MSEDTTAPPLTADNIARFHALSRFGSMLRYEQEKLVRDVAEITGEEEIDNDGLSDSVAWDVVHNGDDLDSVLRRCKLTIEAPSV